MFFCSQHEDVGLNALALQLLHGVLCRLGLEFSGSLEVWDICEVDADGIFPEFPFHLSDGLEERCALDVANSASNLSYDKVIVVFLAE